jgi:hypothetical protein
MAENENRFTSRVMSAEHVKNDCFMQYYFSAIAPHANENATTLV